jgi:serine/threonine protein kinase
MYLHHYFEDWNRLMIIMELCPGVELFKHIMNVDRYDPGKAAYVIKQVLAALYALHDINIVHRDIKPENMLITEADSTMPEVKLVDFGEADIIDKKDEKSNENNADGCLYKRAGTLTYMAPEVFFANKDDNKGYNELCDIWSVGVVAYLLLTGECPFVVKDAETAK